MGGTTIGIGQEYLSTLCNLDFKEKGCTYVLVRCACLSVNLTSPKVVDGLGKLASKSDLVALKAPALRASLTQAEKILQTAWDTLAGSNLHQTQPGMVAMGRLMVRTALFLMKKQGKGRESVEFEDLDAISQRFALDLKAVQTGENPAESSMSLPQAGPSKEEEDKPPMTLEQSSDCKHIAMEKFKLGGNYKIKGGDKVWCFQALTDDHAVFNHKPLFGPQEELKLDYDDLKNIRKYEKPAPVLRDQSMLDSMLPQNSKAMKLEEMKAKAFCLLCSYHEANALEAGTFCLATQGGGAFAGKSFKKHELRLVPVGTLTLVKEKKKSMVAVLQTSTGELFNVVAPKPDWEHGTGTLVPYFAIGKAEQATMEKDLVKLEKWLTVPVYRNCVPLKPGTPLVLAAEEEEQPKKAGKRLKIA